jgi:N-acyl-D-amino-acid deacylase
MIDVAPNQPELVGKSLADIARSWNVDPTEAAIRILKQDDASVAVFIMTEPDIRKAMTQPWVMTSSDGRSGGHPRAYASYPRLWTNYVVDQKVITPVQFVHRSTGLVADTLGLPGRGYIEPGYFADIVVIDPEAYQPKATFAEPKLLSAGVIDVVVNGRIELENGKATGVLSGRGIVKAPPAGTCP